MRVVLHGTCPCGKPLHFLIEKHFDDIARRDHLLDCGPQPLLLCGLHLFECVAAEGVKPGGPMKAAPGDHFGKIDPAQIACEVSSTTSFVRMWRSTERRPKLENTVVSADGTPLGSRPASRLTGAG